MRKMFMKDGYINTFQLPSFVAKNAKICKLFVNLPVECHSIVGAWLGFDSGTCKPKSHIPNFSMRIYTWCNDLNICFSVACARSSTRPHPAAASNPHTHYAMPRAVCVCACVCLSDSQFAFFFSRLKRIMSCWQPFWYVLGLRWCMLVMPQGRFVLWAKNPKRII